VAAVGGARFGAVVIVTRGGGRVGAGSHWEEWRVGLKGRRRGENMEQETETETP